ncbi:MAG TPA: hypothetical protein VFG72_02615 [Marmoricola sp.]|nr:hypothetical protein [Marmoricola sp.]
MPNVVRGDAPTRSSPFSADRKKRTMFKILLIIIAVLVVLWLVRMMMARSR